MGQRSQIYIRIQDRNQTALFARYYGWNYGDRMVSRARHTIAWLTAYLTAGWRVLGFGCENKLLRIVDTNFDMKDVLISSDLIQEWREESYDAFVEYVFFHDNNNDGKLFIDYDSGEEKVRYAFLDADGHIHNPMNAESYLEWDAHGESWKEQISEEAVTYTLENIKWLEDNAILMTEDELLSFIEAPFAEKELSPDVLKAKAALMFGDLRRMQEDPKTEPLPCPRCGQNKMRKPAIRNSLSRYEDVYICSDCGMDEATRGTRVLPLENWSMVISFLSPKNSTELNRFNTSVIDPEVQDGGEEVQFLLECWFDWDRKFGTSTASDDDTWLNVYATYNPTTRTVSMCYTVDDNNKNESFVYEPTSSEKELLITLMEEYFQKHDHCSVSEFLERFRNDE